MEWKKFHDSCNELHTYISGLETKIQMLEGLLSGFLAEEDVVSLPSYKLLTMQYTPSNLPIKKSTTVLGSNNAFDPLYAPPNARRNKQQVKVKELKTGQPMKSEKLEIKSKTNINHEMADETDEINSDEIAAAQVGEVNGLGEQAGEISYVDVVPTTDDIVFTVELNGVCYYFHNNYLYDTTTLIRMGKLTNDYFLIDNKQVSMGPQVTVSAIDDYPGYFKDDTNKVYQKLHDNVVQNIGQYIDGEVHAWP